jgi:disulfide bond formation protein DsbB
MRILRAYGLYWAWVISLAGTLCSLYYSDIQHVEPCRFCWFQRIALFPLAIQLGIAAYLSDDRGARLYGIPLCIVGLIAALLQSIVLALDVHGLCGPWVSCQDEVVYLFGQIPFPWLSGFGFILIALLLWVSRPQGDAK